MENEAGINIEWVILLGSFGMITLALSIIVFAALYQRKYAQKKAQLHEKDLQHQKLLVNAVIETKEQEQKRIAMELHDDVGSALTAIKFMVSGIEIDPETKDVLQESITSAITNVRRISNDLLPSTLDEMGLKTALQVFVKGLPESVHLTSSGQEWTNLPKSVSLALYRITQELVNNILKYAEADVIRVDLSWSDNAIRLTINDNGKGFIPSDHVHSGKPSLGLKNIESRVQQIGAKISYFRKEEGGTRVECIYTR